MYRIGLFVQSENDGGLGEELGPNQIERSAVGGNERLKVNSSS